MYKVEIHEKEVTMDQLLEHYNQNKVEGYCMKCPNYHRIWSCPPHDFDPYEYLNTFNFAQIIGVKIIFSSQVTKEEALDIFQKERRKFSDLLISKENNSTALISGNCYQCETCTRAKGEPCILEDRKRYSLESLGLMVGTITEDILNIELKWTKTGVSEYFVSVGALLKK